MTDTTNTRGSRNITTLARTAACALLAPALAQAQPAPAPPPPAAAAAPAPAPAPAPGNASRGRQPAVADKRPLSVWDQELPTVATVRAKIRGKDAQDTQAQQDAAFEVLDSYIKVRTVATASSGGRVGPLASKRMGEYMLARKIPRSPAASAYLEGGLPYHRAVLARLFPPEAGRVFEATLDQAPKMLEARQRREAQPANQAVASDAAPTSQVGRWVSEVRAAAVAGGVDLSVLGLKLAQPLGLPACSAVTPPKPKMADPKNAQELFNPDYFVQRGTDPTPTRRCSMGSVDPSSNAMAEQMAGLAGVQMKTTLPAGVVREYVYLPPQDRPSWFSSGMMGLGAGSVAAVVAEGQVVAVEVRWLKSSEATFTTQAVQAKFPGVKPQRSNHLCTNKYGGGKPTYDVTWSMPMLRVTYGLGCGANEAILVFETQVMDRLMQRANTARIANEPKL
jgi:hypothetical protein